MTSAPPAASRTPGVLGLVVVGRAGEGDEDGRPPGGDDLGAGRRAGPADDEVGLGEPAGHVVEEGRDHGRVEAVPAVFRRDRAEVGRPGLMDDPQALPDRRRAGAGRRPWPGSGNGSPGFRRKRGARAGRRAASAGRRRIPRGRDCPGRRPCPGSRAGTRSKAATAFRTQREEHPVGESGPDVLFEDEGRDPEPGRQEDDRAGAVAADADDEARPEPDEQGERTEERPGQEGQAAQARGARGLSAPRSSSARTRPRGGP